MANILKNKKFYIISILSVLIVLILSFGGYCIYNKTSLKNEVAKIEEYYLKNYSKKKFVKSALKDSKLYNKDRMKIYVISNFDSFLKSNLDLSTAILDYSNLYNETFGVLSDLKKMKGITSRDYSEINSFLGNFQFGEALNKLQYITFRTNSNDILAKKKFLEGMVFELNFDIERAKDLYLEATKLNEYEPKFYNYLGKAYYRLYDFNSAIDVFVKGLNISNFGTKKNRIEKLDLLFNLARTYNVAKDSERAFNTYTNLLVNAININNSSYEWLAIYNIANIEAGVGNYDTSMDYLNYALKLATKMRNKEYIAKSLNLLSRVEYKYGDYTNGKRNGLKAIKFSKKISNLGLMADSSLNVCLNYEYLGKNDLAKLYCDRAIKINNVVGNVVGRPEYYIQNGFIYNFVSLYRDYEKSIANYNEAYRISQTFNLYLYEVSALYGMSEAENDAGKYDEAIKLLRGLIKIEKRLDISKNSCYDCSFGSIYWRRGDNDKSINYYKSSILSGLRSGNNLIVSSAASQLANIYYSLEDYREALKYSTLALSTDRKIYRFDHHYIRYQEGWQETILNSLNNKKGN